MILASSATLCSTLTLRDALPICGVDRGAAGRRRCHAGCDTGTDSEDLRGEREHHGRRQALALAAQVLAVCAGITAGVDRKSTRLNSSHTVNSYAVFCPKKKKNTA